MKEVTFFVTLNFYGFKKEMRIDLDPQCIPRYINWPLPSDVSTSFSDLLSCTVSRQLVFRLSYKNILEREARYTYISGLDKGD